MDFTVKNFKALGPVILSIAYFEQILYLFLYQRNLFHALFNIQSFDVEVKRFWMFFKARKRFKYLFQSCKLK